MKRHNVRLREQCLDWHGLRTIRSAATSVRPRRRSEQPHPERRRERRHSATDRAKPNNSQRVPLELREQPTRPLAAAHITVHCGNSTGNGEHQRERMFRHGVRIDPCGIRHGNAATRALREVDMIGAGSPNRNDAELRATVEHRFGELGVSTNVEHSLGVANAAREFYLVVRTEFIVYRDIAKRAKLLLSDALADIKLVAKRP